MATYINNKKASFNYEFLKQFEAGIALLGCEVKSVRKGQGNLEGAHVAVYNGEAYLTGATIPAFQEANAPDNYEKDRARKLLLSKKELLLLEKEGSKKGLTVVPIRLYNNNRNIKLSLALARGKKQFDKRETVKARDTKRDLDRELKGGSNGA